MKGGYARSPTNPTRVQLGATMGIRGSTCVSRVTWRNPRIKCIERGRKTEDHPKRRAALVRAARNTYDARTNITNILQPASDGRGTYGDGRNSGVKRKRVKGDEDEEGGLRPHPRGASGAQARSNERGLKGGGKQGKKKGMEKG